jgi:hypothetical protein
VCGVLGALAAFAIAGTSANAARGIATTTVTGTLPVGLPAVDTQFKMTTTDAQNFSEFALFSPGDSVDGTSETEILRMIQSPSPTESALGVNTWMNMVDFIYGSCSSANASDEQTCSPPIEVQNWPACDRSLSLYPASGSLGMSYYIGRTSRDGHGSSVGRAEWPRALAPAGFAHPRAHRRSSSPKTAAPSPGLPCRGTAPRDADRAAVDAAADRLAGEVDRFGDRERARDVGDGGHVHRYAPRGCPSCLDAVPRSRTPMGAASARSPVAMTSPGTCCLSSQRHAIHAIGTATPPR